MAQDRMSSHSVCRWTFNAGKGGFVPASIRPEWEGSRLDTVGVIRLIKKEIAPRMPAHVQLGFEVHYDTEIDERTAAATADALGESQMYLGMITPGAHSHFGYGGIASLDPDERAAAEDLGRKTVDLAYGPLRKAWHPDAGLSPTLVLWNGSYGYDLASVAIKPMYQNLKAGVAGLCRHEAQAGGAMCVALEPKPNEGHPAMLIPTVASAILFWRKLEEEFGIPRQGKGVNKEFGHSEMIGLDPVYDSVEELDNGAMVHVHLNSQGLNDGLIHGGPGKYDIDHGARVNGLNVAIAGLLQDAGYRRWKGHDMQVRPYDNVKQGVDRVIRSILSWEACESAARELDTKALLRCLAARETAQAEDLMRAAVVSAQKHFDQMYRG
jgi:xylose isomerase